MTEPQCKRSKMPNGLEELKSLTTVVADTGDFEGKNITVLKNHLLFLVSGR